MKKTLFIITLFLLLILSVAANSQTKQLLKNVICSGAVDAGSNSFSLQGTIGQTAVSNSNSSQYKLSIGFWNVWGTESDVEENRSGEDNLSFFPNPASDFLSIKYKTLIGDIGAIEIMLIDLFGKKQFSHSEISSTEGEQTINVDLSGLPPGIYFVLLKTKSGVQRNRVVVVR